MAVLDLGRGTLDEDLRFTGEVAGGGAVGPGYIGEVVGYNKSTNIRMKKDNRSGSKRSGSCIWQLEADKLYILRDIAYSSSRSKTYYVTTAGGIAVELDEDEYEAERARQWPLERQDYIDEKEGKRVAHIERIARETEQARIREEEREALKEINAEKAAEIEEKGQEVREGLPELTGTPKQIAYALSIRDAYAAKNPSERSLKTATTAKYWIENHRSVLFHR